MSTLTAPPDPRLTEEAPTCLAAPTVKGEKVNPAAPTVDPTTFGQFLVYLTLGTFFGILLIKSEVSSWYRIQEMFRFQAFHMYGVIGSAVAVAALGVWLIQKLNLRTYDGHRIAIPNKEWGQHRGLRYWAGGFVFGLGWALLGACPGPLFALMGAGYWVMFAAFAAALAGTWFYALVQPKLPH